MGNSELKFALLFYKVNGTLLQGAEFPLLELRQNKTWGGK